MRTASGVCFSPVPPIPSQKIGAVIVVGNRAPGYCLRNLNQSVVGQLIRYLATYDNCHPFDFSVPLPIVYSLSLGPLAAGSYQVEFDAPSAPGIHAPPFGPISYRTQLDVLSETSGSLGIHLAIEFYRASVDHYFLTADADEISKLDSGPIDSWRRTGESFNVYGPATPLTSGLSLTCRFYGKPSAGLDSHFFSASPVECQAVIDRFSGSWVLESNDIFVFFLPDAYTGPCPSTTVPIYRLYNNRRDANHRYTASLTIRQQMIAMGWIPEGYGPWGIAICASRS